MLTTRKAIYEDYACIANIHFSSWNAAYAELLPATYVNKANSLPAKVKMWQKIIVHPDVSVWIAYDDNKPQSSVGFIGCFNKGDDCEITTLYVLPEYQGLGIGSQLMTTLLEEVSNSTMHQLYLWVLETNTTAMRFYNKFGFVLSGERSEELHDNNKIVDIKMVKSA